MTAALHEDSVSACVFAGPTRLVSGSIEGALVVWDWAARRAERTIPAHRGVVWSIVWDAAHEAIISAGADGRILFHQLDGTRLATIEAHTGSATALAIAPDGERLASGGYDGAIHVWRLADGAPIATLAGHDAPVTDLDFLPDGRLISGGRDDVVRIWAADDRRALGAGRGHSRWVTRVRAVLDGGGVLSASEDGTLRLWDADTLTQRWGYTTEWERPVWGLGRLAPDAALAGAGGLLLRLAFDGSRLIEDRPVSDVTARAIAVEGDLVALGSGDIEVMRGGEVAARLATNPAPTLSVAALPRPGGGVNVALGLPDGRVLFDGPAGRRELAPERGQFIFATTKAGEGLFATGGFDAHVRLWRADDGAHVCTLEHGAYVFSIAERDGRLLVSGGGRLSLFDIPSGALLWRHKHPDDFGFHDWSAFGDDAGDVLLAGDFDALGRFRLSADGTTLERETRLPLQGRLVTGLRALPAPDAAVMATSLGDLRRLDLATGCTQVLHRANESFVRNFHLSPDKRFVISSSEHGLSALYDLAENRLVTPAAMREAPVQACCFGPAGEVVLVTGEQDVRVLPREVYA